MRDLTFGRKKAATSTFFHPPLISPNTPILANPIRGFGLPINNALIQTASEVSTEEQEPQSVGESSLESLAIKGKPLSHDISRIALHRPQAKLTVGEPGDKYEQEVDWMANQVMRMPDTLRQQPMQWYDKYHPSFDSSKELLTEDFTQILQPANARSNNVALVPVQRKEVNKDTDIQNKQDWTTADRQNNTQRWKDACLANLNAIDSSQYVKVVERRDFYKWFYEYTAALGYSTRWALAAYVVANGAHQIADMDVDHSIANDALGMANVELQGAMREGNQVIFDNVLPKLKKLIDGGPLKGRAALNWDMQVLAEEQTLIQPMYSRMSQETVDQLNYIARKKRFAGIGAWWSGEDKVPPGTYNNEGIVPGFDQPNIQDIGDRWKYGMNLGNQFTKGGSGFDPNKDTMPAVGAGYQDGSEFRKVDTRANLHKLDAWLNPNRVSRVGSGSDIQAIIDSLSAFEKQQVLSDHSPDGWSYSTQFAQFGFITEAMVKQALPSDPASASAVAAFLARYKAERNQVELKYPTPMPFPM
ncbi:hypothetical protein [Nostoc sp. LEGE 12450]|uniref:hypothetical protein n=1 Tax=Nostoc sp. LEGE 12450 TaxID=1828643 RepID=UPI00188114C9|nr:hypothetical protein [Nostoc sp. LEGE 12450]MBE8991174.1 hypothetical protein [Nostoc sp. LEGE 12450]